MRRRRAYATAAALLLFSLLAALIAGDVDRSPRAAVIWTWLRDASLLGGITLGLLRSFIPEKVPAREPGIDYYG